MLPWRELSVACFKSSPNRIKVGVLELEDGVGTVVDKLLGEPIVTRRVAQRLAQIRRTPERLQVQRGANGEDPVRDGCAWVIFVQ
jgi:hypothetical protein